MPTSTNCSDNASLCSTLVVPTSTERPVLCIREISTTTARHFPEVALNTTSDSSFRIIGLLVGTTVTLSLYILSNSVLSVAAVPVIPHSLGN
eukprot:Gb_34936 [translate_table: standard]